MKKMFFALVVLSVSQLASATSLRNVRLMYQDELAHPQAFGTLASVVVFADGEVQRFDCPSHLPVVCQPRTIARLSARQIDSIDRLIEEAREGELINIRLAIACTEPPMLKNRLTADNGSVLLTAGHKCLGSTENQSPAAGRLITILMKLKAASQQE